MRQTTWKKTQQLGRIYENGILLDGPGRWRESSCDTSGIIRDFTKEFRHITRRTAGKWKSNWRFRYTFVRIGITFPKFDLNCHSVILT